MDTSIKVLLIVYLSFQIIGLTVLFIMWYKKTSYIRRKRTYRTEDYFESIQEDLSFIKQAIMRDERDERGDSN